jgi:hypothetical protein
MWHGEITIRHRHPSRSAGYIDFERLFVFTPYSAFFVVRTKENVLLQRRYSHPLDKTRRAIRSHSDSDRDRFRKSLSRFLAPSQLSRHRNQEASQVLDQIAVDSRFVQIAQQRARALAERIRHSGN